MITIELDKKDVIPFDAHDLRIFKYGVRQCINYPKKEVDINFFGAPDTDVVYHSGYLGYLAKAWENHYSVVMTPDNIWFMIVNEIALAVKEAPERYTKLFTKTPNKKQWILVPTLDPTSIRPQLVINALKDRVPIKTDLFLPEFSTSTPMSIMAMNVAFCDVVSPYYSYGTFLCGIPNIRIEGTEKDWSLLLSNLKKLSKLFKNKLDTYLDRCVMCVDQLIKAAKENNSDYFKTMVKLEKCGSGHQFDMNGWILQFLRNNPRKMQLEGLPSHFSKMDYMNLDTERTFSLFAGVFYSKIEGEFLVPCFDSVSYETFENKPVKVEEEISIKLTSVAL